MNAEVHASPGSAGPSMNPDMSWMGVLEHHAIRTPSKAFAVFGADTVTYREMVDRSTALAASQPLMLQPWYSFNN